MPGYNIEINPGRKVFMMRYLVSLAMLLITGFAFFEVALSIYNFSKGAIAPALLLIFVALPLTYAVFLVLYQLRRKINLVQIQQENYRQEGR